MFPELNKEYKNRKNEIKKRLLEFKKIWSEPDKRIFSELCFCLCNPQSKAVRCDKAVSVLEKSGVLFTGGVSEIKNGLWGVRFPNNKAKYLVKSRELFTEDGVIKIKKKIDTDDIFWTRAWLVQNVLGIGFKEASHFLRNIGFGKDLAILDVHILRNMLRYRVISSIPKNISVATYLSLENKLRDFSEKAGVPLDELDLLFWSMGTGEVFK